VRRELGDQRRLFGAGEAARIDSDDHHAAIRIPVVIAGGAGQGSGALRRSKSRSIAGEVRAEWDLERRGAGG
jgi:hypothetical protein